MCSPRLGSSGQPSHGAGSWPPLTHALAMRFLVTRLGAMILVAAMPGVTVTPIPESPPHTRVLPSIAASARPCPDPPGPLTNQRDTNQRPAGPCPTSQTRSRGTNLSLAAATPGCDFELWTAFPRKALSDSSQTISEANLLNAALTQSLR